MYNPHLKLDFSYFVMERSRKMAPHDGMGDVLRKAYFSASVESGANICRVTP